MQPPLAAAVVLLVVVLQPLFVAAVGVAVAFEYPDVFVRLLSAVPAFAVEHVVGQHSGALVVVGAALAVAVVVAFVVRGSVAMREGDHWRTDGCPGGDLHSDYPGSDYLAFLSADDLRSADSDSQDSDLHLVDWHSADSRSAGLGWAG